MAVFVRCRGRAHCVEGPGGCRSCGRSPDERETTRLLVAQAAQFILEQNYDNASEFASYLAEKIERKVTHVREQSRQTGID